MSDSCLYMIILNALISLTQLAASWGGGGGGGGGEVFYCHKDPRSLSAQSYLSTKTVMVVLSNSWVFSFTQQNVVYLARWSRIHGRNDIRESCSDKQNSSLPGNETYVGVVYFACYLLAMNVITFFYYSIHKVCKNIAYSTFKIGGRISGDKNHTKIAETQSKNCHVLFNCYSCFYTVVVSLRCSVFPYWFMGKVKSRC